MARINVEQEFNGAWKPQVCGVSRQALNKMQRGVIPVAWDRLIELADSADPLPSWAGEAIVARATSFAIHAHHGQTRKNGTPYYGHCLTVGGILAGWGCPWEVVTAGLLHDVVEDCGVGLDALRSLFGQQVTEYVRSVTELVGDDGEQDKGEYFERQAQLASQGYPGVWIAIADKLHNGRCFAVDAKVQGVPIKPKWISRYRFFDHEVVAPFAASVRTDGDVLTMRCEWDGMMQRLG